MQAGEILRHLGLWEQGIRVHSGTDPPAETTIEPRLDDPFPDYDTEPTGGISMSFLRLRPRHDTLCTMKRVLQAGLDGRLPVPAEKRVLISWPIIRWAVVVFDTIFIRREKRRAIVRVNKAIARATARDEGLVLFAEGTSSGEGSVLPLKPSLLEWSAAHAQSVYYGARHYRTRPGEEAARTAVCWWGERPFFSHLMGLLSMPGFEAVVAFGAQPVTAPDRKRLAERLHELVEKPRQESASEGDAPSP